MAFKKRTLTLVLTTSYIAVTSLGAIELPPPGSKISAETTKHSPSKYVKNSENQKTIIKKLPNGIIVKIKGKDITIIMPPMTKAQKADQARHELVTTGAGSPTASISAPNAFGSAGTVVFANASYVNHWATTKRRDGVGGVGISAGNPNKYFGVLVSANIGSFGFDDSPFASNGGVSLRLNRYLNPTTAIAVGTGNLFGWGAYYGIPESYYASLTKSFYCFIPMTINIGAGTGSFNDAIVSSNNDSAWQPYASMGFGLFKNFSFLADWTSNQVNLGGAYTITYFKKLPIFAGVYAMNVNGTQNTQTFFQGTVGAAYQF
ncbi:MAG: hypothetical protein NTZ67_05385 [Gammaproteobacteria bacterium]|nr:hypothetical protein [Gammaproteobacteria bacterium]